MKLLERKIYLRPDYTATPTCSTLVTGVE